jgi:hypothetical protein
VSIFLFFFVLISFASFVSISHDHRPNLFFFIASGTERNGEGWCLSLELFHLPMPMIVLFIHFRIPPSILPYMGGGG